MDIKKNDRLEITELFMAQADHERCFYGIIKRGLDERGKPFVFSRIVINNGLIYSRASEQKELGKYLDEMCKMVLDYKLHEGTRISMKIFDTDYILN
jgi:hypothetical protein